MRSVAEERYVTLISQQQSMHDSISFAEMMHLKEKCYVYAYINRKHKIKNSKSSAGHACFAVQYAFTFTVPPVRESRIHALSCRAKGEERPIVFGLNVFNAIWQLTVFLFCEKVFLSFYSIEIF